MSVAIASRAFDAELALGDLFTGDELAQWQCWLSSLAGCAVAIEAPSTQVLARPHAPYAAVLQHELEPLLVLSPEPPAPLPAALVDVFTAYVRERIRYRLASDLQSNASARDWAALQASEARYRALAADLEQQVRTQVTALERARLHAFQAEHQRAVAQLAAGMAHEINNPIGFIASNLRTARGYLAELRAERPATGQGVASAARTELLDDFQALLEECAEGAARVARIVGQLRVFSQVDATAVGPVRPRALVEAALALLAPEIPAGLAVQVQGDPEAWTCEAAALSQAVFQLLRNALQAVGDCAGTVQVLLRDDGAGRTLAVKDSGCGMEAAVLARAADPFFSTRDVGQGMGLGLSVAADVARRHGGRLELRSVVGQGTVATLCLGPAPGGATGGAT